MQILGIARATLIYLSLAIHREEAERNKSRGAGIVARMPLQVLPKKRMYDFSQDLMHSINAQCGIYP